MNQHVPKKFEGFEDRQTGRTSSLLKLTKPGVIFLVQNHSIIRYCERLCRHLGIAIPEMYSVNWLEGESWRGRCDISLVIFDHNVRLNERQRYKLDCLKATLSRYSVLN